MKYFFSLIMLTFPIIGLILGKTQLPHPQGVYLQEHSGISVHVEPLLGEQSKEYLTKDLNARGIQPVKLWIDNRSSHELLLAMKDVSLPQVSAGVAAMRVAASGLPRSIGYQIAGMIFWPFMIPGTINSLRSMATHSTFKHDLKAHCVKPVAEVIPPYAKVERMVLVPEKKFSTPFTVTFKDKETNETIKFEMS